MDGHNVSLPNDRASYQLALLSEIRMLLDYVAASPNISLADFAVTDARVPGGKLDVGQILERMETAEATLHGHGAVRLEAADFAILQLARDGLVRKAAPASGLTIAFTALVSGQMRRPGSESRASLAGSAYFGLASLAGRHVIMRNVLLALALVVTLVAGWESAKVALGRSLLQSLDLLRTQQAAFTIEKNKLEASLDPKSEGVEAPEHLLGENSRIKLAAFSLCNRPYAIAHYMRTASPPRDIPPEPGSTTQTLKMYASSQERDICERDGVLGFSFRIVHQDLTHYRQDWAGMVGSVFAMTAWVINHTVCAVVSCNSSAQAALGKGEDDVEFIIAPMLLVWGNYVLPVIFGLLGSLIFVILDFYNKTRASTLHPRDTMLGVIRLVLGMVTGACIGLFFSASGPGTGGNAASLVDGLSLSASGLAFLAGFGVEGVFTMLEGLVRQAFPGSPPAQK